MLSRNWAGKPLPSGEQFWQFQLEGQNTLAHFQDRTCVLLLGEPDAGKSTDIQEFDRQLTGPHLLINLKTYSDAAEVRIELMPFLEQVRHNNLTLLIDSLDEGVNTIPNLALALGRWLKSALGGAVVSLENLQELEQLSARMAEDLTACSELSESELYVSEQDLKTLLDSASEDVKTFLGDCRISKRCHLRIACRTNDLPISLRADLKQLYESVDTLHLLPMREAEVRAYVSGQELDPDAFMAEVRSREVEVLAAGPQTLAFLIEEFQLHQALPASYGELVYAAARRRCSEPDPDRAQRQAFDREQLLGAAERVAFMMAFGHREFLLTLDHSERAREVLLQQEDVFGVHPQRSAPDMAPRVDGVLLRAMSRTALFTAWGHGHIGFVHRVFREVLAARYARDLSIEQVRQLLFSPVDGQVLPQLFQETAHLASLRADVFGEVLRRDPEVLLRSDLPVEQAERRAQLTQALLERYGTTEALQLNREASSSYWKLAHPELPSQLRPFLHSEAGAEVRRFAVDVTEACCLTELIPELTVLSVSPDVDPIDRINAAGALAELGELALPALKALLELPSGLDPNDDLRGKALLSLWPEHISADQMFAALIPPQTSNVYSWYARFLHQLERVDEPDAKGLLTAEQLPAALHWASRYLDDRENYHITGVVDNVLQQTVDHLNLPEIATLFAQCAFTRMEAHDEIFTVSHHSKDDRLRLWFKDVPERRHRVLQALIDHADGRSSLKSYHWGTLGSEGVLLADDLPWLNRRIVELAATPAGRTALQLYEQCLDINSFEHMDALLTLADEQPWVRETIQRFNIQPVQLLSTEAQKFQTEYSELLDMHESQGRRRAARAVPVPPSALSITLDVLSRAEADGIQHWPHLAWVLRFKEGEIRQTTHDFEADTYPGWLVADSQLRARILAVARKYLVEADVPTQRTLLAKEQKISVFAGYEALTLVIRGSGEPDQLLPQELWARWAQVVVASTISSGADETRRRRLLLQSTYEHAPEATLAAARFWAQAEDEKYGHIQITAHLEAFWDDRIGAAFEGLLRRRPKSLSFRRDLIATLLKHGSTRAETFVRSSVKRGAADAAVLAALLLKSAPEVHWPWIGEAARRNSAFGRALTLQLGDSRRSFPVDRLLPEQVAEVYRLLMTHFPVDPPFPVGVYTPTAEHELADIKGLLRQRLTNAGTLAAATLLYALWQEYPEQSLLQWAWQLGLQEARRKSWVWPTLADLASFLTRSDRRLVRDADELLLVVTEALIRLETRLRRSETPLVNFLWNDAKNEYSPKSEESLSDYVKVYLDDELRARGIVLAREVEVSRGNFTDIHVVAMIGGPDAVHQARVIVEVKGNWHKAVGHALDTQLVGQYLRGECRHGIYLVGWFNCKFWKSQSHRSISFERRQHELQLQADNASSNERQVRALLLNCGYIPHGRAGDNVVL